MTRHRFRLSLLAGTCGLALVAGLPTSASPVPRAATPEVGASPAAPAAAAAPVTKR